MRSIFATALLLAAMQPALAQDFPGFRAGNYTGVNSVFFNPASIADSRYRFDFNLISVSTMVANNKASFNLKNVTQSFDGDKLENEFIGSNAGLSTGLVSVNVHGPSLMFNAGRRSSIALTTRVRTMANIVDMDGQLAGQLMDNLDDNATYPYSINSNANMRLRVNAWTEFGASYAHILKTSGVHFLKGGFTVKYLAGAANGYLNIDNLNATLNQTAAGDDYLQNTTGRINIGFGGLNVSNLEPNDFFKMESSGIGADLGLVYEYRPDHIGYSWDYDDDRFRNKYKFKLGAALLDVGSIKYQRDQNRSGGYNIDITGAERLYLSELEGRDIDEYKDYFNSRPQFFSAISNGSDAAYKVSLPTTLQLDLDYNLHRGFYAQLAAQLPLSKNNEFSSINYTSVTFTPRYEGRAFGFYLPVNYNSLTQLNAGVSLRFGPLFFGSGSLLTAALGSSKQADVHVGLRFGGLHKKKKKKVVEADEDDEDWDLFF
ncbi:MAG: DUF5723 family protein [Chitinophagaceae bacterium]